MSVSSACHFVGDTDPAAGEALPLIAQSSVVTAHAALALHDLHALLNELAVLAALDIEACPEPRGLTMPTV